MTIDKTIQDKLLQRLTEKFSSSEARYMMRCLMEDLSNNNQIEIAVDELLVGKPLQYVTGVAWFYKMKIEVNASVLIPRPETEELVEWVADSFEDESLNVIDIGTGSGCIAIALKRMKTTWRVDACDISVAALATAKRNSINNQTDVNFFHLDITNVPESFDKHYDLIISNPPYVTGDEALTLAKNVIDFEPHLALFALENQPLFFYQVVLDFARKYLKVNGSVFVEINQDKAEDTFNLFVPYFRYLEMRRDLSGNFRMLMAHGLK